MNVKAIVLTSLTILASIGAPVAFAQQNDIEIAYTFDKQNPPGNIAINPASRIFMSTHHFYGAKYKVVEVLKSGKTQPYPNSKLSQTLNPVLGIVADKNGILWILETATENTSGRVIGWDTKNNILHKVVYLSSPLIPDNSFLNDLAIDTKHNFIYITDTAGATNSALLTVSLNTGEVRRVLSGSIYTIPEKIPMTIDNNIVKMGNETARIGVNPITIDDKNEWVYFGAMTGTSLYRLSTADLSNSELSDIELSNQVEFYAKKPISDGITIDSQNNIYVTDITNHAIGYIDSEREYHTLYTGKKNLSWTDGFANGADGYIYVTVNQLHLSPVLNGGKDDSSGKYTIQKFKPVAQINVGR